MPFKAKMSPFPPLGRGRVIGGASRKPFNPTDQLIDAFLCNVGLKGYWGPTGPAKAALQALELGWKRHSALDSDQHAAILVASALDGRIHSPSKGGVTSLDIESLATRSPFLIRLVADVLVAHAQGEQAMEAWAQEHPSAESQLPTYACSICLVDVDNPIPYPWVTCWRCDEAAKNNEGKKATSEPNHDDGDNPVFINGVRCWRRYRFGVHATMRGMIAANDVGTFMTRVVELVNRSSME